MSAVGLVVRNGCCAFLLEQFGAWVVMLAVSCVVASVLRNGASSSCVAVSDIVGLGAAAAAFCVAGAAALSVLFYGAVV